MNIISIGRLLAFIMLFVACLMCIPLFMSLHYKEFESSIAFLSTIAIMVIASVCIVLATRKYKKIKISSKSSYLFVTATWVLISFFGALPLWLTKTMPTFALCYFEIMSGFTTTGATAMVDIEAADMSILFWRNMTNWLGGMGIVVLFIAVLPALGVQGAALVGAESVGPTKEKLTPQIQNTAIALWSIYIVISIVQVLLLLLGGLDPFDALTVTFGTMGAAGFAPKNASIAAYNSPYVEWICIIFMFLAGANFALYFKVLQGKTRRALKDGELRAYFLIVISSIALITINLLAKGISSFSESLRNASFQVISFITTTGFTSTNYTHWPVFSQCILLALCFVGGCAGSAGGGIKVIRVVVMAKLGKNAITKRIHPSAVTNIKVGEDTISPSTVFSISGFVGMYLITALLGTIIVSLADYDIITSFTSTVLCLGNIGIGFGGIGTDMTFAIYPDWTLWVFSFLMLVGRLELFTVYSLFTRDFWKK